MTGPFKQGDIIVADVKGRLFAALVENVKQAELEVSPLTYNVNYFTVRKRDVQTHWRKKQGPTPTVKPRGGVTYGG